MKHWPGRELCKLHLSLGVLLPGSPQRGPWLWRGAPRAPSSPSTRASLNLSPSSGSLGVVGEMPFGSGVKMPCCCRECSVAVPEHSPRPPFWPSPAGMGGGRWVVSRATGTPGLSNFCSILSLKLGCDCNISGSSLSVWFFFVFTSQFCLLPPFWKSGGKWRIAPAWGLDCNFCREAPRASAAMPINVTQKPVFI